MQKKCLELRNANASTMDRAKVVEDMLEEEQRKEKILLQDLEKMQGILFRAQQTFMDQKEITKLKEIEINKVETSIGLMRKQARSYYLEIQGLNEMLYELVSILKSPCVKSNYIFCCVFSYNIDFRIVFYTRTVYFAKIANTLTRIMQGNF